MNDNKISVLLVQPDKKPQMIEISNTVEGIEKVIGGEMDEYMPFEDEVSIVCNRNGKEDKLPLNRAIYSEHREVDMTYQEMKNRFREREKEHGEHLTGYIVFSQDSFTEPYSLKSRTYVVSSDNKAFQPSMGGYSIYADSLDGTDRNVRIEQYMSDERGGKDGWKVERCYQVETDRKVINVIRGDFLICKAPIDGQKYESLPLDLADKYKEKFKFPEKFHSVENGYIATPYKPISKDMER